jgi:hypothetical protein
METKSKDYTRYVLLLGLFIPVFGLLLFAYMGIYNRWFSDDWCYSADLKTFGFWGAMKGYTFITHTASNRIFSSFLTYLLQTIPFSFGLQALTAIIITSWYAGILLNLDNINRLFQSKIPASVTHIITALILFFTIYLAPHRFQSIYWLSGIIPYTFPVVLILFILAIIGYQTRQEKKTWWTFPSIFTLAFIVGTSSEVANLTLTTTLTLLLIFSLLLKSRTTWKGLSNPTILTGLAGAILAMIVLVASPANAVRQALGDYKLTPPVQVPFFALKYSLDFIMGSLVSFPIPYLVLIVGIAALPGLLHKRNSANNVEGGYKKLFLVVLGILVSAFLIIAALQMPSTYMEKGPPHPRALIGARFIVTSAIAACAWLVSDFLVKRLTVKGVRLAFGAIFILSAIYVVRTTIILAQAEIPLAVQRAALWDERDQFIWNAEKSGVTKVEVWAIDGSYMEHTRDFKEKSTNWINACAAIHYGVDEIIAIGSK